MIDTKETVRQIKSVLHLYFHGDTEYWRVGAQHRDTDKIKIHRIDVDLTVHNAIKLTFACERPGLLIGPKGQDVAKLKKYLEKEYPSCQIHIYIKEYSPWRD